MTWLWRLVAVATTAAVVSACGGDDAGSGDDGAGGGGGAAPAGVAVVFAEASPLVLAPGQIAEVTVTTQPPGPHVVAFLLLGESLDASLEGDEAQNTAVADDAGRATVVLQAPSQAASFEVRAVVDDGPAAQIEVRVSELGSGALLVLPTYAGERTTASWTAAVVPRASCAELSATADPDDAIVVTADEGEPLLVEDVPVGPRLAVIARSAGKVWGCADAVLERADVTEEVEVAALDRPIQLGSADLAVELGLEGDGDVAAPLLDRAATRIADATFPEDGDPATILLDAMALHLEAEAGAAFADARAEGLDAALAADLSARGVAPRGALLALLAEGAERPLGSTTGRLASAGGGADHAVLTVDRVLGVEAERAGAPHDHLVPFGATPGDLVSIGGVVFFFPSRLLGALAEDALAESAPGTTPGELLAATVDCAAVATVVGPVAACDASCVAAACELALPDVWERGLDASAAASDLGSLSFAVSADAEVDDEAALVGFEGTWVGAVGAGGDEAAVGGPALAEATAPPESGIDDGSDAPRQRE